MKNQDNIPVLNLEPFRQENWNNLDHDGRIEALQNLENYAAYEQGRDPRAVSSFDGDPCSRGSYDPERPDSININNRLIDSDNPNQAMRTTLHEGRHAYQDDIVSERRSPLENKDIADAKVSSENKELWTQNMPNQEHGVYNSASNSPRPEYRYQPIEADANDYADNKMASFSNELGDDPNYISGQASREYENAKDSCSAIMHFNGHDPKEVVAQDISSRSQDKKLESKQEAVKDAQQSEAKDAQQQPEGQDAQQPESQDAQQQSEGQNTQQRPEGQDAQQQPEGQDARQQSESQDAQQQPEGQDAQQKPEGQGTDDSGKNQDSGASNNSEPSAESSPSENAEQSADSGQSSDGGYDYSGYGYQ